MDILLAAILQGRADAKGLEELLHEMVIRIKENTKQINRIIHHSPPCKPSHERRGD